MNEALFNEITTNISEDEVNDSIIDCMEEFLSDDWDTEFDDIIDAYEETGRGGAESQVLNDIIKARHPHVEDEAFCEMFDALANHWNLSTS